MKSGLMVFFCLVIIGVSSCNIIEDIVGDSNSTSPSVSSSTNK